jgi:hypothetical protein
MRTPALTLALLACSAGAASAVPLWRSKATTVAGAKAALGDQSYVGRPCPTRAEPPPQTALRLPDDVPGALVAAIELTLLDGTKLTVGRGDAAAAAGARGPLAVAGATRYGGAPVNLGPDVKPNDVATAFALLRGGKRVELSVPERSALPAGEAAADPVGCWRPRKDGPRRAGPTWGGFDAKAARVLPPVVAAADPNAVRAWASGSAGAAGHPWVDALMAKKQQQQLLAAGAAVVGAAAAPDEATATGSALGDFLQPVFAGGRR